MNRLSFVALALFPMALGCATAPRTDAAASPSAAATLDGRSFAVEGTWPSGERERVDLAFAAGMLDSSACRAKGLPSVPYAVARDGSALTFHAERHGEGTDSWTGRVDGNAIEGTFASTKPGATPLTVAFRGHAR